MDLNISWDYDTHSEESGVGGVWRGISVVGTAAVWIQIWTLSLRVSRIWSDFLKIF